MKINKPSKKYYYYYNTAYPELLHFQNIHNSGKIHISGKRFKFLQISTNKHQSIHVDSFISNYNYRGYIKRIAIKDYPLIKKHLTMINGNDSVSAEMGRVLLQDYVKKITINNEKKKISI